MEKFMEPEMELVTFDSEDVIMTSGGCHVKTEDLTEDDFCWTLD